MERVRTSTMAVTVNGRFVRWSAVEVTSSASPYARLNIYDATVAVGDIVMVAVDDVIVCTGVVWQLLVMSGAMRKIAVRSDFYKLHASLGGGIGWHNDTIKQIISDVGAKVGVSVLVSSKIASIAFRRFSVHKDGAMIDALIQMSQALRLRGCIPTFYVNEHNVLVFGVLDDADVKRTVKSGNVLRFDAKGAEVLPQALLYSNKVVVGDVGVLWCASAVHHARASGRQYVRLWGHWE